MELWILEFIGKFRWNSHDNSKRYLNNVFPFAVSCIHTSHLRWVNSVLIVSLVFLFVWLVNWSIWLLLQTLKVPIPRSLSKCLTFLQLLQMVIAVVANAYTDLAVRLGNSCARDPTSIKWSWAIYGTYVFLFAQFFYQSYYSKKSKKA